MSSKYSRDQIETVLRTAVTNMRVNQQSLRRLPVLTDDPTDDGMVCALHAMDGAIYNLREYAKRAGIDLRDSMKT